MKDKTTIFEVNGKKYTAIFNLNVMQEIQSKYGTFQEWSNLAEGNGKKGEADIKALIFGIKEMINEAIDIENETLEEKKAFLTEKQVGRIVTEMGLMNATKNMSNTVIEAVKEENPKNV